MTDPQTLSADDIAAAQAALDSASLAHWRVVGMDGKISDPIAYLRAERSSPKNEAIHRDVRVLVELCRAADARLDTSATEVHSGISAA